MPPNDDCDFQEFDIENVRCVAHTLQLAVEDALALDSFSKAIGKARSAVKSLRNQTVKTIIRREKKMCPLLDCSTRFISYY